MGLEFQRPGLRPLCCHSPLEALRGGHCLGPRLQSLGSGWTRVGGSSGGGAGGQVGVLLTAAPGAPAAKDHTAGG